MENNQDKPSAEEKVNHILRQVCQLSGETELPVRTFFDLSRALQIYFNKVEARDSQCQNCENCGA